MLKTTNTPAAAVELRLTDLGRQLLALIARHGEAMRRHNEMRMNDPRFPEAERRANAGFKEVHAAVDAILTAPDANIGDLAVACEHVFLPGASSDEHEQIHARLTQALLGAIGLTRQQCDFWGKAGADDGEDETGDEGESTGEGERADASLAREAKAAVGMRDLTGEDVARMSPHGRNVLHSHCQRIEQLIMKAEEGAAS